MGSRQLRTEADIQADKKVGKHRRSERVDEAVTLMIILSGWFLTVVTISTIAYMAYLYFYVHMTHPEQVSTDTITTIETLAKLGLGAVGGYLTQFIKRNTPSD